MEGKHPVNPNPGHGSGLDPSGEFRIGDITLKVQAEGVDLRLQQAGTGRVCTVSQATLEGVLSEYFFPPEDGDAHAKAHG